MLKRLSLLLLFLTASTVCNGCARQIVLHPLTDKDIRQENGWICMSPEYVNEVMKARLGK